MKPSDALEKNRDAIKNLIARFPVTNPRVFGSVTLKTDTDNSGLDLLVDALSGTTLFDLGGLQSELEDLLGIHVDLITPGDLPIRVRQQVVTQAIPL
ncbi:MAG: nucleotidyltransferase family protein [Pseudomonadota bacterium]